MCKIVVIVLMMLMYGCGNYQATDGAMKSAATGTEVYASKPDGTGSIQIDNLCWRDSNGNVSCDSIVTGETSTTSDATSGTTITSGGSLITTGETSTTGGIQVVW